ncbi:MAG: DUF3460 family protein [Rhodocyclaceae bacterium]|nr:DUF3460 family protein [Rhodocyclaceae bacterium]
MAYESEYTQFMRAWLEAHPEERAVQQSGRALWWDRGPRDLEEEERRAAARVPQKPYYYDVN